MRSFEYIFKDEAGIHARPAGMLVREAAKYAGKIMLKKGEKEADCKNLVAVMALGAKCGDKIVFELKGTDEDAAYEGMKAFVEENM